MKSWDKHRWIIIINRITPHIARLDHYFYYKFNLGAAIQRITSSGVIVDCSDSFQDKMTRMTMKNLQH